MKSIIVKVSYHVHCQMENSQMTSNRKAKDISVFREETVLTFHKTHIHSYHKRRNIFKIFKLWSTACTNHLEFKDTLALFRWFPSEIRLPVIKLRLAKIQRQFLIDNYRRLFEKASSQLCTQGYLKAHNKKKRK